MSAQLQEMIEPIECAFCGKDIALLEPLANYIGQTFHEKCCLLFRIQRLEQIVSDMSYRERL